MTSDLDDQQDDDVLSSLARLRPYDVSPPRARQLRRRCHAVLQAAPPPPPPLPFQRLIVPALGGAWCLAYLVEIIRCTAAIYRYFGPQ